MLICQTRITERELSEKEGVEPTSPSRVRIIGRGKETLQISILFWAARNPGKTL